MLCSDSTKKLLTFLKIKGIGNKAIYDIASLTKIKEFDLNEIVNHLHSLNKYNSYIDYERLMKAEEIADADISQALKYESKIISFLDPEYPKLLSMCGSLAPILYIKGHWHTSKNDSIAVIGTREPTLHGKIITERVTDFFVENNWSIVSGLAIGCDTIAHKQAVKNGGHTVAVLSHGLHTIAPKQNMELAKKILDSGGLLVTEYAFGVEAKPYQFVARDKIQAALSKVVVMVQSDVKGGSLHASRAALNYDRILAVPYPTTTDIREKASKIGANLLIADGSDAQKSELLKCEIKDLERMFVIRDKSDYNSLCNLIEKNDKKKGQRAFEL